MKSKYKLGLYLLLLVVFASFTSGLIIENTVLLKPSNTNANYYIQNSSSLINSITINPINITIETDDSNWTSLKIPVTETNYDIFPLNVTAKDRIDNISITTFNLSDITNLQSTSDGDITIFGLEDSIVSLDATDYFTEVSLSPIVDITPAEEFLMTKTGEILIRVFDGTTSSLITQQINLSIRNSSNENNYTFTGGEFTAEGLTISQTFVLDFRSNTYANNIYYLDYTETAAKTVLNIYMLKTTTPTTVTVLESAGDLISNANVQLFGYVDGDLKLIYNRNTDGIGQVVLEKVPDQPYLMQVSNDGFITSITNYDSMPDEITITLQAINILDFDGTISGISYDYEPETLELTANTTQLFSWLVDATAVDNLEFYGFRITNNSIQVAAIIDNTDSNGGQLNITFDTTPYTNDTLVVTYFFKKTPNELYELEITYNIREAPIDNMNLKNLREWSKTNIENRDKIILWTLFLLIAVIVAWKFGVDLEYIALVANITSWILGYSLGFTGALAVALYTLNTVWLIINLGALAKRGGI